MDRAEIGQAIKTAMKEQGKTMDDVVRDTGITIMTVNSLRQGAGNPTIANLMKVLDHLGLEIEVKKKKENAPTCSI